MRASGIVASRRSRRPAPDVQEVAVAREGEARVGQDGARDRQQPREQADGEDEDQHRRHRARRHDLDEAPRRGSPRGCRRRAGRPRRSRRAPPRSGRSSHPRSGARASRGCRRTVGPAASSVSTGSCAPPSSSRRSSSAASRETAASAASGSLAPPPAVSTRTSTTPKRRWIIALHRVDGLDVVQGYRPFVLLQDPPAQPEGAARDLVGRRPPREETPDGGENGHDDERRATGGPWSWCRTPGWPRTRCRG